MELQEALYTTRAMRRVKPDPIPQDVQKKILDAAIRAPTGGNAQGWRFLLVDDADLRGELGALYRKCMDTLWGSIYKDRIDAARAEPDTEESRNFEKMYKSAEWLGENFAQVPLVLLSFVQFDTTGGSIYPATWSAQLAARGEGVGSALTSVFMLQGDALLDMVGVPKEEGWIFANCVTFGYPTGRWGVAPRRPVHEVAYRNRWGADLGFEIPDPLWKG